MSDVVSDGSREFPSHPDHLGSVDAALMNSFTCKNVHMYIPALGIHLDDFWVSVLIFVQCCLSFLYSPVPRSGRTLKLCWCGGGRDFLPSAPGLPHSPQGSGSMHRRLEPLPFVVQKDLFVLGSLTSKARIFSVGLSGTQPGASGKSRSHIDCHIIS